MKKLEKMISKQIYVLNKINESWTKQLLIELEHLSNWSVTYQINTLAKFKRLIRKMGYEFDYDF